MDCISRPQAKRKLLLTTESKSAKIRQVYRLHYGQSKRPLAEIAPDSRWPGMWRISTPDGRLSDMINLCRARDAAFAIVERGPPVRNRRLLRWQITYVEDAATAPPVRSGTENESTPTEAAGAEWIDWPPDGDAP